MNAEPTNDRRDVVMTADYSGELLYAPARRFQTRGQPVSYFLHSSRYGVIS